MNIKILNPLEISDWNQQVAALPGSTIFHTANWARVLTDAYGYRPKYFCTLINGKLQNVIPAMEIQSPFTGTRGCVLPFSDQVEPLVGQGEFAEMFDFMIDHGRRYGWRTLDFHGGNTFFSKSEPYASYMAPSIQLNASFEGLFKNFRSSTRHNVRKAQKLGVTTSTSTSKASVDAFRRLNSLTRKKHGLPPQPVRFFDNIHRHILAKGKGFVCLARFQGEVIAGVVFFVANHQAIYKYGASDARYLRLRPNNLAMATAIKQSEAQGAVYINLGRTEKEKTGQLQFKMGWNAKPKIVNYYKIDVPMGKFIAAKPMIRSSYYIFKRLPLPILKLIGTLAYRHIG